MSLIAIGEVTVDWLGLDEGKGFQQQEKFQRGTGGNASNVACGVSRLGLSSSLIGKVGDDLHARYIRESLKSQGVDLDYLITDASYPTAQCYVTTDGDGKHSYYNWPSPHAAQMLTVDELTPEMFERGKVLHATGVSLTLDPRRNTVLESMRIAEDRGLILSFDCGFPTGEDRQARLHFDTALAKAHLLKVNEFELEFWSEGSSGSAVEDRAAIMFARYRPCLLFVTLAEAGSLVVSQAGIQFCSPFSVESAGGVGAGDAFMAGVLFGLLSEFGENFTVQGLKEIDNQTLAKISLIGNAAGALATRRLGAVESLACRNELAALINGMDA